MLGFAGLLLLGLALGAFAFDFGEDEDIEDTGNGDDTPRPDPDDRPDDGEQDLGASFAQRADGTVELELGADERGSLAVFVYTDTEDNEQDFVETYEARFYLVPEGVTLPQNTWETRGIVPGAETDTGPGDYEIEDLETAFGLELLGRVDLGVENAGVDTLLQGGLREDLPPIEANAPVPAYYVEATTDSDELVTFYGESVRETFNGATLTQVREDAIGTMGADWFQVPADAPEDLIVNGRGGNDALVAEARGTELNGNAGDDVIAGLGEDMMLRGGAGDDDLRAYGESMRATGGEGDDDISMAGSGEGLGGAGNDQMIGFTETSEVSDTRPGVSLEGTVSATGPMVLRGEEGDDGITISGPDGTAFGGPGDDSLAASSGATVHGGGGADTLDLDSGTTGFGGPGDDTFIVWNQFRDEDGPAVATGGAGADTFDARVWNPFGDAEEIYLEILDFDPAEDTLQVGVFQTEGVTVEDIRLVEAADGSGTDVGVLFRNDAGLPPATAVIRLDGVAGLPADRVVIV